jgi:hypothetical protein
VVLGAGVVNNPELAEKIPGAQDGYCEALPKTTFTGTDCNSLYFTQYKATEGPSRLDHLLARDPTGRIRVEESGLAFTDRKKRGEHPPMELSDHYGVQVRMSVQKMP